MNPLPTHRISLEPRGGSPAIYLMFYETLVTNPLCRLPEGSYKQQLLRIFKNFESAEKVALFVIADRKIESELIIRDDSQRNVMLRKA